MDKLHTVARSLRVSANTSATCVQLRRAPLLRSVQAATPLTIVMTYDTPLDLVSVPPIGSFAVSGKVVLLAVILGFTVVLTLLAPVLPGDVLTPGVDPIRNALGLLAPALAAVPVLNLLT